LRCCLANLFPLDRIAILLILVTQVSRITGVNHWCLTCLLIFNAKENHFRFC
jgi:hypothetical protein